MKLLVDTTPLRISRDFRRLWVGQAVSLFGTMVTTAALPFQVFDQTGSSLAVGLLGAAQLGPLLVCAVVGVSFAVLRSMLPLLLDQDLRPAGFALQSIYTSFGWMAGPAVAGVLISGFGLASAYSVDVGT